MQERFKNHGLKNPQRKRLKIIEQSPDQIIADITYFEELSDTDTNGTVFSADIMNEFDNRISDANEKSDNACTAATQALETIAEMEQQIVNQQGTKVLASNTFISTFDADTKADKTELENYLPKEGGEINGNLLVKKKACENSADEFNVLNVEVGDNATKNRVDVNGNICTKGLIFSSNPGSKSLAAEMKLDENQCIKLNLFYDKDDPIQSTPMSPFACAGYKTDTLNKTEGELSLYTEYHANDAQLSLSARKVDKSEHASLLLSTKGNMGIRKYQNNDVEYFNLFDGQTGKLIAERFSDLISLINTGVEDIKSYYATWKFTIGNLKIIGGATPGGEGNRSIYFRMNNATDVDIFDNVCLGLWCNGRWRNTYTSNGWQYTFIENKGLGRLLQISDGSYWFAIGY